MNENRDISFLLKGIELLEIQLNQPEKPLLAQATFLFEINLEHRIIFEDKLVVVICVINVTNEDKSTRLGLIKASCIFEVLNFSDFVDSRSKQVDFPEGILITFNSITVSTVRGIMYSQFKGTFLHGAFLPVINPQALKLNKK